MPWSAIPKFPEIIENLKKAGYKEKANRQTIVLEIKRTCYISLGKTLSRTLNDMTDLGYIKDTGESSIFWVCQNAPYDFPKEKEDLDKYD